MNFNLFYFFNFYRKGLLKEIEKHKQEFQKPTEYNLKMATIDNRGYLNRKTGKNTSRN